MYLKTLKLINSGPIKQVLIDCQFGIDGSPKPIIIVGRNGSGKSIALAHIVSAIITAHSNTFEDADVEKGKVFKLRSSIYIRHGSEYSIGEAHFTNGYYVREVQLARKKSEYESGAVDYQDWDKIASNDTSHWSSNLVPLGLEIKGDLSRETHLYFPPQRFEEPAWLNEISLKNRVDYSSLRRYDSISNRPVIVQALLKDIQSWLLDLIYDSFTVERKFISVPSNVAGDAPRIIDQRVGPASRILESIEPILRAIFDAKGRMLWHVGERNSRSIGISFDDVVVAQNLFGLSTGQTILLDLFFGIVRDADLAYTALESLGDIHGMVVVDEIDLHLHTDLQHSTLPALMALFPKVQFIVTTHSPLFVVGVQKTHSETGVQIVEFPEGVQIEGERFSEFSSAYSVMSETSAFQRQLRNQVISSTRPMLYVEGATDIDFLKRGASLLGRAETLDSFDIVDAVGTPHLRQIWDTYKTHLNSALKTKHVLLYDCESKVEPANIGVLYRRVIPRKERLVNVGIENLFSDDLMRSAVKHKAAFLDIVGAHASTERGVPKENPEVWTVNRNEKRNLCDWICTEGDADDFEDFSEVFDILDEILNDDLSSAPGT